MNPTKYFSLITNSCLVLLIVGLFGQAVSAPQEKGRESRGSDVSASANNQAPAQVIDDLIVSRKAALDGVEYEEDGSLSLQSPTDYQAFKALNSGPGAAINFNIAFAHNSVTMTADGNRTLEMIANAINFLGTDVRVEILILKTNEAHNSGRSSLTKRRGAEVIYLLNQRFKLKNEIELAYSSTFRALNVPTSRAMPQLLPIVLINNGEL